MAQNSLGCEYSGLEVTPTELIFEAEEGYTLVPPSQQLHIKKVGPGTLTPSWETIIEVNWLRLHPNSGSGAKNIVASINTTGMPVGTHTALITFTSDTATNTPRYVNVRLIVHPKLEPLKIVTTALPDGIKGDLYLCALEAEGGKLPYNWGCSVLPDGLSLNIETGHIYGVPTADGTFKIAIMVTDSEVYPSSTLCRTPSTIFWSFTIHSLLPCLHMHQDQKVYTVNIAKPPVKVAITAPAGGEVLYIGDTYDIKWVPENVDHEVLNIEVREGQYNGVWVLIAESVPISSLKYSWLVNGHAYEKYVIRLTLPDGSSVQSDPFEIRERSGCSPFGLLANLKYLISILKGKY